MSDPNIEEAAKEIADYEQESFGRISPGYAGLRTRVIVSEIGITGRFTWRAPICKPRGYAIVQLVPLDPDYADAASAKQSGHRNVEEMFPGIVFE